ncbi:UNVERIFIED_CONTAM: E3 ubiquitin-protein ligase trim71 [Gekko kuhli]
MHFSAQGSPRGAEPGGGGRKDRLRRLHVLPCLHAFCRQCLEAQRHPTAGDSLKLRCPICDQKVVISEPSGMDALPSSNFLLSNLLDVVVVAAAAEDQKNNGRPGGPGGGGGGGSNSSSTNNRHHNPRQQQAQQQQHRTSAGGSSPGSAAGSASSGGGGGGGGSSSLLLRRPHSRQGEPRCSSCDEGNAASSRCLDCQEHLCDNCVRAHQRVRLTKDHFIERFGPGPPASVGPGSAAAAQLALSQPYSPAPYNILSVFPDRVNYCQHHDDEVSPPSFPA